MRLLLSGKRGIGKTTCCRKTIGLLDKIEAYGFMTHKIEGGLVIEDIKTSESVLLATEGKGSGEKVGKYFFSKEGIDFGIESLKKSGDVCFVDEIGRLELSGKGFYRAFPLLREKECIVITCRDIFADDVKRALGFDDAIIELINEENRDMMPEKLYATIMYHEHSFYHGSCRDRG